MQKQRTNSKQKCNKDKKSDNDIIDLNNQDHKNDGDKEKGKQDNKMVKQFKDNNSDEKDKEKLNEVMWTQEMRIQLQQLVKFDEKANNKRMNWECISAKMGLPKKACTKQWYQMIRGK